MTPHEVFAFGWGQFGQADFEVPARDFRFAALQRTKQPAKATAKAEL
jgi:hypothetical protein